MEKSLAEAKAKVETLPPKKRLVAMSVVGAVGAGVPIVLTELLKSQPNWVKSVIGAGLAFWLYNRVGKSTTSP